jgi:hypothetical protein
LSSPHLTEFASRLDELLDGKLDIQRMRRVA